MLTSVLYGSAYCMSRWLSLPTRNTNCLIDYTPSFPTRHKYFYLSIYLYIYMYRENHPRWGSDYASCSRSKWQREREEYWTIHHVQDATPTHKYTPQKNASPFSLFSPLPASRTTVAQLTYMRSSTSCQVRWSAFRPHPLRHLQWRQPSTSRHHSITSKQKKKEKKEKECNENTRRRKKKSSAVNNNSDKSRRRGGHDSRQRNIHKGEMMLENRIA